MGLQNIPVTYAVVHDDIMLMSLHRLIRINTSTPAVGTLNVVIYKTKPKTHRTRARQPYY